jgi:hypothetical protein
MATSLEKSRVFVQALLLLMMMIEKMRLMSKVLLKTMTMTMLMMLLLGLVWKKLQSSMDISEEPPPGTFQYLLKKKGYYASLLLPEPLLLKTMTGQFH